MNNDERTPPDPTLCIDFPWKDRPVPYCGNCGSVVSYIEAKQHALIDRYTDGCGIVFENVTTRAAERAWQARVATMRPDLTYVTRRYA